MLPVTPITAVVGVETNNVFSLEQTNMISTLASLAVVVIYGHGQCTGWAKKVSLIIFVITLSTVIQFS